MIGISATPFLIDYDSDRDIGKSGFKQIYISRLKNKKCNCESSQKFRENKIKPVFLAFGSEKQKANYFSG